jgi:hypothetical protein
MSPSLLSPALAVSVVRCTGELKGPLVHFEEGPPEQVLGSRGERLPWLMEVVYGEDAA